MKLNDEPSSLYDVLELTPDATPQEIRSAYLRLKSAYNKDNIAHYTLFSREETEKMLNSIENAYLVLSNPESRRNYDLSQGHSGSFESPALATARPQPTHTPASRSDAPGGNPLFNPVDHALYDVDAMIQKQEEWSGESIKKIREARRITLDDLCDYTRISKAYLSALEEEDYNRLPALVYVRGFLQQVGKRLKIPVETLVTQYIARLKAARPDKA